MKLRRCRSFWELCKRGSASLMNKKSTFEVVQSTVWVVFFWKKEEASLPFPCVLAEPVADCVCIEASQLFCNAFFWLCIRRNKAWGCEARAEFFQRWSHWVRKKGDICWSVVWNQGPTESTSCDWIELIQHNAANDWVKRTEKRLRTWRANRGMCRFFVQNVDFLGNLVAIGQGTRMYRRQSVWKKAQKENESLSQSAIHFWKDCRFIDRPVSQEENGGSGIVCWVHI